MGILTFLSSLSDNLLLLTGNNNQHLKGLYGKWKIAQMGPAKSLEAPEQSSIIYNFNVNNTLTIQSPYKNAQRKFHTRNQHIKFDGLGLFGTYNKFNYSIANNTMTLKTDSGFVVKLQRI